MLLEVKDIHVHYGKIEALKGISVEVDEGEIVTLIGANGAGKTTTLKTISGLRGLSSGSISFDGKDISKLPGHKRVVAGIGQAPEGRGIFPGMTVQDNLLMGAYTRTGDFSADLAEVYELFPRLAERKTQMGGTMSGGEQQMLAIGRALMAKPKVLLLDEPSMGLAPMLVQQIFSIIAEINRRGTTVLLVEQNAQQALQLAHRAYVLETGKVVKTAPAADLLNDPAVQAAYLGGAVAAGGAGGAGGAGVSRTTAVPRDTLGPSHACAAGPSVPGRSRTFYDRGTSAPSVAALEPSGGSPNSRIAVTFASLGMSNQRSISILTPAPSGSVSGWRLMAWANLSTA